MLSTRRQTAGKCGAEIRFAFWLLFAKTDVTQVRGAGESNRRTPIGCWPMHSRTAHRKIIRDIFLFCIPCVYRMHSARQRTVNQRNECKKLAVAVPKDIEGYVVVVLL